MSCKTIKPRKNDDNSSAWKILTDILETRIKNAENVPLPSQSFEDVTEDVLNSDNNLLNNC